MAELNLVSELPLTVPTAEQWIRQIADERTPDVLIDLSACRRVDGNAGWRLGNAARGASFPSGRLVARVPWKGKGDNDWFLNYTRSGLGQALARHAAELLDADGIDVGDQIRGYYSSLSEYSASTFRGLYGIHSLQRLVSTETYFFGKFVEWLSAIVDVKNTAENAQLRQLSTLCWEAVTNIVDHSNRSPLAQDVELTQSISLRWYKTNAIKSESAGHAAWRSEVNNMRANVDLLGFLEILAADNGVGIAARQAQTSEIYRQDIADEEAHLVAALQAGSTIKLTTNDAEIRGDPGFGYTNIASTIGALGAWGLLRTGRLAFECNGLRQGTTTMGFTSAGRTFGYMPGTTVQVTVPVHSNQMSLELEH